MITAGVLLAAAAAPAPPPDFSQLSIFATAERRPAFEATTRVRVGTFEGPMVGAGVKVTYWFIREREDGEGRVTDRAAANSKTCPAVLHAIRGLEHLRLPTPDVPGYSRDYDVIVMDGTTYLLTGTSRHSDGQPGDFSVSSNTGTPLATWTERLFLSLESCWKETP
jgi:hypothetical protein